MKKTFSLPDKLKNYSLMAGSILGSSFIAQGQVIFKDINPDVELGGVNPASYPELNSYDLDLNNDGIVDFSLKLNFYGTSLQTQWFSFREIMSGGANFLNAVVTYTIEYKPFLLKLDACDSIPIPYLYGGHLGNFAFQNVNSIAYNWDNIEDRYIGLNFQIDNEPHYGWLRVAVNIADTVPNIILKDFAYQDSANEPISVCDTGLGTVIGIPPNENNLQVFPNPSSGNGVIQLPHAITGEFVLSLTDALGKEVYVSKLQMDGMKKEIPYNFSQLSSGIYIIQLKSKDLLFTQKWIKK
ncbi:MAG: T9SS type A sorting domain-containing protein [Chitinophagales bacterium]